jgi:hypothetical protein
VPVTRVSYFFGVSTVFYFSKNALGVQDPVLPKLIFFCLRIYFLCLFFIAAVLFRFVLFVLVAMQMQAAD